MTSRLAHAGIYAKLLLTGLFWGGTFVAGRVAAPHVGPYAGAFLRFAMASVLLVPILLASQRTSPWPSWRDLPKLAMLGVSGMILYNVFFFKGLQTVTAGRAAVIVALNPSFIALFSALFFHDRLTMTRGAGLVLSLMGAMAVIAHGRPMALLQEGVSRGDVLILGCVGSWVVYTLLGKEVMVRLSPLATVTWSSVLGAIGLACLALHEGISQRVVSYPPSVWLSSAYLAVFGTVFGFVWFYQGVKVLGATRAGVFINFVPASSVFLGVLLLGEDPTFSLLLGLAMVSLGVYLSNLPASHAPPRAPSRIT